MRVKLYVNGLPASFSRARLFELFAAHGTVVRAQILKAGNRRGPSLRLGYVEMATKTDAQRAIDALDFKEVEDFVLHILPAQSELYRAVLSTVRKIKAKPCSS